MLQGEVKGLELPWPFLFHISVNDPKKSRRATLTCVDEAELGGVSGIVEVIGVFKRELDDLEDRSNDNDMRLSSIKHKVFELEEQQHKTGLHIFWR